MKAPREQRASGRNVNRDRPASDPFPCTANSQGPHLHPSPSTCRPPPRLDPSYTRSPTSARPSCSLPLPTRPPCCPQCRTFYSLVSNRDSFFFSFFFFFFLNFYHDRIDQRTHSIPLHASHQFVIRVNVLFRLGLAIIWIISNFLKGFFRNRVESRLRLHIPGDSI